MEKKIVLPFLILPNLLYIATVSFTVTVVIMALLGICALYINLRYRQKNSFFYGWTLSSWICMYLEFELGTIIFGKITQTEHFVFLVLSASTWYFYCKMKDLSDFDLTKGPIPKYAVTSSDLHYTQVEVKEIYFHSIWWDCCVFRANYRHFIYGHVFAFLTLVYGVNLGLTSACRPFILFGSISLTLECSEVYSEFVVTLCYVTCIYGVGYIIIVVMVLLRELLRDFFCQRVKKPLW